MSTDDLDPREPARGKQEATPAGKPKEKPLPHIALDDPEEEETTRRQRRSSPALRLSAWLLAFVLLLVVLGWALGEIL